MTKPKAPDNMDQPIEFRTTPDTLEQAKARRNRNIALAIGLVAFVILVFVVTIVKLGGNVANRPL
jgi:archaellum biogenesis protein FlaJ (TadC family)